MMNEMLYQDVFHIYWMQSKEVGFMTNKEMAATFIKSKMNKEGIIYISKTNS